MATELGRFLADILERTPKEHPDREFLEAQQIDTAYYLLARDPNIVRQEIETARRKIQELVDSDIKRRGALADSVMFDNERKRKRGNDRHGADYIGNLLPSYSRQFAPIISSLERAHIITNANLIRLSDITSVRNIGDFRARFVLAMQDLAIAEKSQAPQRQ